MTVIRSARPPEIQRRRITEIARIASVSVVDRFAPGSFRISGLVSWIVLRWLDADWARSSVGRWPLIRRIAHERTRVSRS